MQQFTHIISDPLGIHARPAGLLAKIARDFSGTTITVDKNGETVKVSQLIKLMGLGIRQGDEVTVTAEGSEEAEAITAVQRFFSENL